MAKYGKKAQKKVEKAMHERKHGTLRSGSGEKVTSRKQAIAIGLSEAREAGAQSAEKEGRFHAKEVGRSHHKEALGALLPEASEVDDDLDRLLHVLDRHPLEPRVKVVLAGEDVRRRQAHEREPANRRCRREWPAMHLEAGPADRLVRVLDDLRASCRALPSCFGTTPRRTTSTREPGCRSTALLRQRLEHALPSRPGPPVSKSRIEQPDAGSSRPTRCRTYGCTNPSRSLGRFGRERVLRQAVDEVGGHLDGVDHPSLGVAGMRVEAMERHRHRVRGKALALDLAAASAVHGVGAGGAEPRDVEVQRAAAHLFVGRERRCGWRREECPDARPGTRRRSRFRRRRPCCRRRAASCPDAVTMSWPICSARAGILASRSTAAGSSGSTRSRPS